jgi:threonine/homoserine/homoserine lactone efflux protein
LLHERKAKFLTVYNFIYSFKSYSWSGHNQYYWSQCNSGKKGGIVSAFGIMSGILVHTMLAAFGLSAILVTSSIAFSIVKYICEGYLIRIGIGFVHNKAHHAKLSIAGSIQQNYGDKVDSFLKKSQVQ